MNVTTVPITLYDFAIEGDRNESIRPDNKLSAGIPRGRDTGVAVLYESPEAARQAATEVFGVADADPELVVLSIETAGLDIDSQYRGFALVSWAGSDLWFCTDDIGPERISRMEESPTPRR